MHCTSCGNEVPDGIKFCGGCGKPVGQPAVVQQAPVQAPPVQQQYVPQQPVNQRPANGEEVKPSSDGKYAVMSVGAYMGSMFVMGIPIIGWLIAIIWACGGSKKVNRRNLARATIIFTIIIAVICIGVGFAISSLAKMAVNGIAEASGIDVNNFSINGIIESFTGGSMEGLNFSQLQNMDNMEITE